LQGPSSEAVRHADEFSDQGSGQFRLFHGGHQLNPLHAVGIFLPAPEPANGYSCGLSTKSFRTKFNQNFLPQDASRLSSVLSATFNFENLYKVKQVPSGFGALRQEMEMIGHKAVGVHIERSVQQIVTK
jgi:hypothetical protein